MPTLDTITLNPPKILLWGKPGVGKTPFVTSYGEGLYFIDTDDGLRSSLTLDDKFKPERRKIEVAQFFERDPTKALAWKAVKDKVAEIYAACAKGTWPYKVLAIDSFTTLADYAKRFILVNSNKPLGSPMSMQLWGLAIDEVDNLFMFLKALPVPVVVIFHSRNDMEGDLAVQEINIFGKNLPAKIIGYFDEVYCQRASTIAGKLSPYLQTNALATATARSRMALADGTKTDIGFRELLSRIGWKEVPAAVPAK